jgi:GNAT superfamily N-acetyltransferase
LNIRMLEGKDEGKVGEFLRRHGGGGPGAGDDAIPSDLSGAAALEDGEILALGFMRAADIDRYELERVLVRPDHRGMGLERQMVLTLELAAEKRRARWFGVWLKSDACDDFSFQDINERMAYLERGYVFRAYRTDRFGEGRHADRLDRELRDVLEESGTSSRRRLFSDN